MCQSPLHFFYTTDVTSCVQLPRPRLKVGPGYVVPRPKTDQMEMTCKILGEDPRFLGVVRVLVPGIYGPTKGGPLPRRMSRLVRAATTALRQVYREIVALGGYLYITDMFRSAADQQRAYMDYLAGRKTAYSPPPCASVHEAARAIDIDAFDTGIGHRRTREILNRHGWTNIVKTLTGPECWHYEFRQSRWQTYCERHGYAAMAHDMKRAIGNFAGRYTAQSQKIEVARLQGTLNIITGEGLTVDGIYGPETREALRDFQRRQQLQIDGVAGPITTGRIQKMLADHRRLLIEPPTCLDRRRGL